MSSHLNLMTHDSEELKELVSKFKVHMTDWDSVENADLDLYNWVMPKYDGWWTLVRIKDGRASVISSGGVEKTSFDTDLPDCVLLSEWIYGTNWAQSHPELLGKFVVFDLLSIRNVSAEEFSFDKKFKLLEDLLIEDPYTNTTKDPNFLLVERLDASSSQLMWDIFVADRFEGLVLRNNGSWAGSDQQIGRIKAKFSIDYVAMEFKEGKNRLEGTLGSIRGGLYINGVLQDICSVSGFDDEQRYEIWNNQDKYVGKVFEATGKALFNTGALRHPAFLRWREDKLPENCTLNK